MDYKWKNTVDYLFVRSYNTNIKELHKVSLVFFINIGH